MEAVRFKLSGATAFFKKPEVNSIQYFTYGQLHKIVLLGILGSIIGLKGYSQQTSEDKFPAFYEQLCDIKIAICPLNNKGNIHKKTQVYNNSVGYASKEAGNNLIVTEQWLEKPAWEIYILNDGFEQTKKIIKALLNKESVYIPYLGKNDHIANIQDVQMISGISFAEEVDRVHSLFLAQIAEVSPRRAGFGQAVEEQWRYKEYLPIELTKETNQYKLALFNYTNMKVKLKNKNENIYKVNQKNLYFF